MNWVLIIIVLASTDGVGVASVPMADQAHCQAAAKKVQAQSKYWISIRTVCAPTGRGLGQ